MYYYIKRNNCAIGRIIQIIKCIKEERRNKLAENIVEDYQCEFQKRRCTIVQIVETKLYLRGTNIYYQNTSSFNAAYDSIKKRTMLKVLEKLRDMLRKLLKMTKTNDKYGKSKRQRQYRILSDKGTQDRRLIIKTAG